VIGTDQKIYGPVNGLKVLQWIADGRINWDTPSQLESHGEWRPLRLWAEVIRKTSGALPPKKTHL
jgi:hypothetical protein